MRMTAWSCALACLLAWSAHAQSPPAGREWKLSTALGPAYPQGKGGELWASLIRERSAGRLAVRHYPGATLVQRDPAREFAALRDGAIDVAVGSTLALGAAVAELDLIALPWLFPIERRSIALLESDGQRARSRAAGSAGRRTSLAWAPTASSEIASEARACARLPICRLARARAGPLAAGDRYAVALGALPAPWARAERRAALDRRARCRGDERARVRALARGRRRIHAPAVVGCACRRAGVRRRSQASGMRWARADRELVRQAARDAPTKPSRCARRQGGDACAGGGGTAEA